MHSEKPQESDDELLNDAQRWHEYSNANDKGDCNKGKHFNIVFCDPHSHGGLLIRCSIIQHRVG